MIPGFLHGFSNRCFLCLPRFTPRSIPVQPQPPLILHQQSARDFLEDRDTLAPCSGATWDSPNDPYEVVAVVVPRSVS